MKIVDSEINKRVGSQLKYEREKRELTKQYVADALGVSDVSVHYWEIGRNGMSVVMLERYCNLLNIDIYDFLRKAGI